MKLIQTFFLGSALFLWLTAAQAADDYLSALEAEADDTGSRTAVDSGTGAVVVQGKGASKVVRSDVISTGLTHASFENELKENYSGSYFLYIKLNDAQRESVFDYYLRDNRVEYIREEIVRQLSSG